MADVISFLPNLVRADELRTNLRENGRVHAMTKVSKNILERIVSFKHEWVVRIASVRVTCLETSSAALLADAAVVSEAFVLRLTFSSTRCTLEATAAPAVASMRSVSSVLETISSPSKRASVFFEEVTKPLGQVLKNKIDHLWCEREW